MNLREALAALAETAAYVDSRWNRVVRELADDFDKYAEHLTGRDMCEAVKPRSIEEIEAGTHRPCSCGLDAARVKWRLPDPAFCGVPVEYEKNLEVPPPSLETRPASAERDKETQQ